MHTNTAKVTNTNKSKDSPGYFLFTDGLEYVLLSSHGTLLKSLEPIAMLKKQQKSLHFSHSRLGYYLRPKSYRQILFAPTLKIGTGGLPRRALRPRRGCQRRPPPCRSVVF